MEFGNYALEVDNKTELEPYVHLHHEEYYKLNLKNNDSTTCTAVVSIDGTEVLRLQIKPYTTITVDRPSAFKKKLVYLHEYTREFNEANLGAVSSELRGLVSTSFIPEKSVYIPLNKTMHGGYSFRDGNKGADYHSGRTTRGGGTGLGKSSDQEFISVKPLDLDYSKKVTIHLRLVPVTRSTPIPPPL